MYVWNESKTSSNSRETWRGGNQTDVYRWSYNDGWTDETSFKYFECSSRHDLCGSWEWYVCDKFHSGYFGWGYGGVHYRSKIIITSTTIKAWPKHKWHFILSCMLWKIQKVTNCSIFINLNFYQDETQTWLACDHSVALQEVSFRPDHPMRDLACL